MAASPTCLAPVNSTPVLAVIPRRWKARSRSLDANWSSLGIRRESASTTVTLGTERAEDAGELDADHTAAQNHHPLWDVVKGQRLVGGHDPAADLQAGQGLGVRAGGQHDIAAGIGGAVHVDGVGVPEGPGAFDELDLARFDRPWRP
jgi:hypothetical protein